MLVTVITQEDGSIVLPDQLLEILNASPGDDLIFEVSDNDEVFVKKAEDKEDS